MDRMLFGSLIRIRDCWCVLRSLQHAPFANRTRLCYHRWNLWLWRSGEKSEGVSETNNTIFVTNRCHFPIKLVSCFHFFLLILGMFRWKKGWQPLIRVTWLFPVIRSIDEFFHFQQTLESLSLSFSVPDCAWIAFLPLLLNLFCPFCASLDGQTQTCGFVIGTRHVQSFPRSFP